MKTWKDYVIVDLISGLQPSNDERILLAGTQIISCHNRKRSKLRLLKMKCRQQPSWDLYLVISIDGLGDNYNSYERVAQQRRNTTSINTSYHERTIRRKEMKQRIMKILWEELKNEWWLNKSTTGKEISLVSIIGKELPEI